MRIKDDTISFDITEKQKILNVKSFMNLTKEIIYYDNPFIIDDINEGFIRVYSSSGSIIHHSKKMVNMLREHGEIENKNVYNQILNDNLLTDIEQEIINSIHGDFILVDDEFRFKETGVKASMSIKNLSAGVKGFGVLLKLIKDNKLVENGTIILDEPEIHLHPKWQIKYAELLVIIQKRLHLHILVNSHSPYFIEALEVYAKKYETYDDCKFYLSKLLEDNQSVFEDVSNFTGKIFEKLAQPYDELDRILYGD